MPSSIDRRIAASKARQDAAAKQAQVQDVNGRMRTNIPGNEAARSATTTARPLTQTDAGKIILGELDRLDTSTPYRCTSAMLPENLSAKAKRAEFVRNQNVEIVCWLRDNDPSIKTVGDMLFAIRNVAEEMIKHASEVHEEGRVSGVLDAPCLRK